MRLSPTRIEQTLDQFDAFVIPDDHPSLSAIREMWGDHTYFLAVNGLNIVEPLDERDPIVQTGTVVNVASWADESASSLAAHEPEPTEVVVEFGAEHDGEPGGSTH
jgi:hypothetical protein